MNLREKLNLFHKKNTVPPSTVSDTRQRLDSLFKPKRVFLKETPSEVEAIVDGTILTNSHEGILICEHHTDISYTEADNEITGALQKILNQSSYTCTYSLKETLFIDTETTGLSGGTGTYAFMIGVGFFRENCFVVRQYFLKKYDSEGAMLESLEKLVLHHSHIISFNGKCYDLPLLFNRFILCQKQTALSDTAHTDLLYPARVLWRNRLDSIAFSTLEKEILHKKRRDDIPGAMIPSAYFRYQRHGETGSLKKIFNHNLDDITGLMLLYRELAQRFVFPDTYKATVLPAARYLFERSPETALPLLINSVKEPYNSEDAYIALKLMSMYYKKQGDYEQAALYWKKMIHLKPRAELYPFVELAKYYEHKVKDFIKARDIVNHALSCNFPLDDALAHRQKRIEQKISKTTSFWK